MSTYVISDIHGCYDIFQAMLKKINFGQPDVLILAGDYLDRGSQNLQIMKWLEQRHENVIVLCGNHDLEFVENVSVLEGLARKAGIDLDKDLDQAGQLVWYKECKHQLMEAGLYFFDYYGSLEQLMVEGASFADLKHWASYFTELPYTHELLMGGRRIIVVHAGYVESLDDVQDDYESVEDFYIHARDEAYLYGGAQHAMIIAGHTPTLMPEEVPYNEGNVYRFYDDEMDCLFYDIDCGCSYNSDDAKMACLRIDDEQIFYVQSSDFL